MIEEIRENISAGQFEFSKHAVDQSIVRRITVQEICLETGEQFFSPETVERLQRMIWEGETPKKLIETPVYEFAA